MGFGLERKSKIFSHSRRDWVGNHDGLVAVYTLLFKETRASSPPLVGAIDGDAANQAAAALVWSWQPSYDLPLDPETMRVCLVMESCRPMLTICKRRCLFVTESGLLGLEPGNLRPRDEVFALGGARVPHVLRQTDVPGEFSLLGDAYVHGIMQGELWCKGSCGVRVKMGRAMMVRSTGIR
ncbi:hypothetical protein B0T26DRAFT_788303 [Lasiosphaeria miniovina]|uniref:Uncharacterized protein n=1 Tax=Lasiosphaeria miniovina TaxID=1954250 RepID=A0AA39ZYK7_9PEZI|nr:uncharacterized protein B0T26DRAFT_788303 [Lasiosphaeria miniovina]KAK0706017.1 hypothetical protein B0T26DRAFT_788303 [Lasiosphaeria miniovina]